MGAFSKALKDAQYLQPLSQSLVNYKKKQDEARGRQALLELMDSLNQTRNQSYQTQYGDQISYTPSRQNESPTGNVPNVDSGITENIAKNNIANNMLAGQKPLQIPNNTTPELPFNRVGNRNITNQQPNIIPTPKLSGDELSSLKTDKVETFNPSMNPADYRKATDNMRGKFSEIIGRYAQDPNISPEQLNQVLQLTQMGIPSAPVTPKYEYKEVDGTLIRVDDQGGIVPVYQSKQSSKDVEVSTYVGSDNFQYTTMRKPTGETYEIKSKNPVRDSRNNTNIKIDTGLKEEKWKEVKDLIVKVKNPFVYDEGSKKTIPLTPEEMKRNRDKLYYTAVTNLVPSAKAWYDKEIKGKWGRENLSQEDFLAELEEGLTPGKDGKTTLTGEAGQDLMEFFAYRPEIFGNLDTKSYKK